VDNSDDPVIYLSDPRAEFSVLPSFFNLIISQLYLPAYGAMNFGFYSPRTIPGYLVRTPY